MSLLDCPSCWDYPCTCGFHEFEARLKSMEMCPSFTDAEVWKIWNSPERRAKWVRGYKYVCAYRALRDGVASCLSWIFKGRPK